MAFAQAAGNVTGASAAGGTKVPWRGSSMSYGHSLSAMTFARTDDPLQTTFNVGGDKAYQYNPTWAHNLVLQPEWHFNDLFFARGRLFISQEFTLSDTTTRKYEVELSDTLLDLGTTSYQEKYSGIRISGNVRFAFPTSRLSQMRTQLFSIGPAAVVSRTFPVLSGLTLVYLGRGTVRFNRYTTGFVNQPTFAACVDPLTAGCAESQNIGSRNPYFDLSHGPSISFQPYQTVSIDLTMLWTRQWLYGITAAPVESMVDQAQLARDAKVRDTTWAIVSASWQFSEPVGVSLTAFTVSPQLNTSGGYTFPLFNRNTVLYLDLLINIEAITSKLFTQSKS